MIRSKPSTDAYREAWERVFGDDATTVEADGQHYTFSKPIYGEMNEHGQFVPYSDDYVPPPREKSESDLIVTAVDAESGTITLGRANNWPTSHESDCPARIGDPCRCPMGNL